MKHFHYEHILCNSLNIVGNTCVKFLSLSIGFHSYMSGQAGNFCKYQLPFISRRIETSWNFGHWWTLYGPLYIQIIQFFLMQITFLQSFFNLIVDTWQSRKEEIWLVSKDDRIYDFIIINWLECGYYTRILNTWIWLLTLFFVSVNESKR